MPRTEFNSTIEKIILEDTKSPITDGVQKSRGFSLSNGRQIALRREDTTEINIWTEKVDLSDDELAKFRREYAADAPRGHSFRTNAPRLHVGYPTYVYKFDLSSIEEETVKKLVRKLLRLMKKIGDDGSNIAIPSSAPKGVAFPPITEQMQVDKDTQRLSTGEREAVVKVRYGQGAYRDELLKKSGAQCWMSGIEGKQLLIASHIKPWFQSKDDEQARGDPDNGLLLSEIGRAHV